jgi:hypothetical protein
MEAEIVQTRIAAWAKENMLANECGSTDVDGRAERRVITHLIDSEAASPRLNSSVESQCDKHTPCAYVLDAVARVHSRRLSLKPRLNHDVVLHCLHHLIKRQSHTVLRWVCI